MTFFTNPLIYPRLSFDFISSLINCLLFCLLINRSTLIVSPRDCETSNDNTNSQGLNLAVNLFSLVVLCSVNRLAGSSMTNIVFVSSFRIDDIDVKHCSEKTRVSQINNEMASFFTL